MTIKKFILITMLTMVICIMSLGYAALQEKIDITGGASVDSVYRVEITKVEQTSLTGTATEKDIPNYTDLNANFNVGLTNTTDSITYNITVSNLGTVDVKLNNTTITTEGSEKISVIKSGINNGNILLAGESKTLTIKIKYDGETETNEITSTIKVTLEYTRLKGGTGEVVEETSLAYLVGDQITFAGSNWYVIEDSPSNQNYVTLMKETVLTNEELGEYGIDYVCTSNDVKAGNFACSTVGEIKQFDTMQYYWSDTCHSSGIYEYTTSDISGCSRHNDYEGSKVKEYLEGAYINTLGEANLKDIDGYKIRLINYSELDILKTNSWINANFGEINDRSNGVYAYWTMTPSIDDSTNVWRVFFDGTIATRVNYNINTGVRPVINLLKASI